MIYRRLVHRENTPRWSIYKTEALAYPWSVTPPGSRGQSVRVRCFRTGAGAIAVFGSADALTLYERGTR